MVVVSDHGMIEIDENRNTKMINIENIVNVDDVQVMLDRGTTAFIIPNPNKEAKVGSSPFVFKVSIFKLYIQSEIELNYRFWMH